MTLSKTIYLQNKQLDVSKASFKLAWQRQTTRQQWAAGLLALLLGGSAFFLLRKANKSAVAGRILNSFFSALLVTARTINFSQSVQASLNSHSGESPLGS